MVCILCKCIALTFVKLKTAENVGTNSKMYWLIVRKPLAVKNDGRLSSGRASAWIAAWLETQGFFLLFAILRPTLFTGKRGLYFKSETWTKSLVVEFWTGKGSNSIIQARLSLFTHQAKASRSTLEGFLFSRNTWNVLWLFRLRKKWWANLLCGTWRKPRCVGIYALLKYSPSYCPCSGHHHTF